MSQIVKTRNNLIQLHYKQKTSFAGSASGFSWGAIAYPEYVQQSTGIDMVVFDYKTPSTGDILKFNSTGSTITNILSTEIGSDTRQVQATINIADNLGFLDYSVKGMLSDNVIWTGTMYLTSPSQEDFIFLTVPQTSANPQNGDTILIDDTTERTISNVTSLNLVSSPKQFMITISNTAPEKVIKMTGKGTGRKYGKLGVCLKNTTYFDVVTFGKEFTDGETVHFSYYLNEDEPESITSVYGGSTVIEITHIGNTTTRMNLTNIPDGVTYLIIYKFAQNGISLKYFQDKRLFRQE